MSDQTVTLIDYGIGNLYSVQRALECCGATVTVSADPNGIDTAQRLVLPGVGAFADGMAELHQRGLVEPLRRYAASNRPLLGICLGMQMLATASTEFGEHAGLGLIPGRVLPVPNLDIEGRPQKIPHIGWSGLMHPTGIDWQNSMLGSTADGTTVYLVHSFHLVPDNAAHRLADCDYGGHRISAAVRAGSVVGCQFHPEKSGPAGLKMLARFLVL